MNYFEKLIAFKINSLEVDEMSMIVGVRELITFF